MFAALLGLALATVAQERTEANATYHRTAAGTLDASDWTRADSTEGAYSIDLPCKFNDVTSGAAKETEAKIVYIVACDRADNVRFFASRMEYADLAAAEKYFAEFPGGRASPASQKRFPYRGQNAIEITTSEGGRCSWIRVVRAGVDNLLLIAEPLDQPCKDIKADVARFFDSADIKAR